MISQHPPPRPLSVYDWHIIVIERQPDFFVISQDCLKYVLDLLS